MIGRRPYSAYQADQGRALVITSPIRVGAASEASGASRRMALITPQRFTVSIRLTPLSECGDFKC